MCGGYSMRYKETLKNEQERWICSRHTLGEDADGEMRYCQGSARRFPWEAELEPHTYHSKWCKPVPDDEEVGDPPASIHPSVTCASSPPLPVEMSDAVGYSLLPSALNLRRPLQLVHDLYSSSPRCS